MSTPYSHRVPEAPSESTATALLPHCPPLDAPDMHPPTCRAHSEQSRPIRTSSAARADAIGKKGTHSDSRLVSAESELGTLPFSELLKR
jgi:hypothetical protein